MYNILYMAEYSWLSAEPPAEMCPLPRQEGPHPHMAHFDAANKHLLAPGAAQRDVPRKSTWLSLQISGFIPVEKYGFLCK